MEEFDSHTEHAQEQAHEAAHESRERWITGVALTAALLAALAAVASMLSGHHEHEAMTEQLRANDEWSYFQSTGVKLILREAQLDDLKDMASKDPKDVKRRTKLETKVEETRKKKAGIQERAFAMEKLSKFHDHLHMMLAGGVTLFQVSIAVAAISALTRRREYWFVGMGLGTVALGFLAAALLTWGGVVGHKPEHPHEEAAEIHAPVTAPGAAANPDSPNPDAEHAH